MKKLYLTYLLVFLLLAGCAFAESAQTYRPGDTIEDFTVTVGDGESVTLSEVLREKDLVLINVGTVGHDACRQTLSVMEEAYLQYKDHVEVIVLGKAERDATAGSAQNNGYSFGFAEDTPDLSNKFGCADEPVAIAVDRFGVICYIGDVPQDVDAYVRLFDVFVGDGYEQSRLLTGIPGEKSDTGLPARPDIAGAPAIGPAQMPGGLIPPAIAPDGAAGEATYEIYCVDQNGAPVPGVMVQICDDATCRVVQTDAEGMHVFTGASNAWEFHVLIAPEGYTANSGEIINAPADGGEITFILKKE